MAGPYILTVPVPALNVPGAGLTKSATSSSLPELPLIVPPELSKLPVEVATPEPISRTPLLAKVEPKSWSPELEPIEPALVTAPVKVKVPEVEVTVVPVPMVEMPVTVRFRATVESVPAPEVTNVPATVGLVVMKVAVPAVFCISTLLKAKPTTL